MPFNYDEWKKKKETGTTNDAGVSKGASASFDYDKWKSGTSTSVSEKDNPNLYAVANQMSSMTQAKRNYDGAVNKLVQKWKNIPENRIGTYNQSQFYANYGLPVQNNAKAAENPYSGMSIEDLYAENKKAADEFKNGFDYKEVDYGEVEDEWIPGSEIGTPWMTTIGNGNADLAEAVYSMGGTEDDYNAAQEKYDNLYQSNPDDAKSYLKELQSQAADYETTKEAERQAKIQAKKNEELYQTLERDQWLYDTTMKRTNTMDAITQAYTQKEDYSDNYNFNGKTYGYDKSEILQAQESPWNNRPEQFKGHNESYAAYLYANGYQGDSADLSEMVLEGDYSQMQYASSSEKGVINYLVNTNQIDKLDEYVETLRPILNMRMSNSISSGFTEELKDNPSFGVGMSISSILASPVQGLGGITTLVTGDPYNPWTQGFNMPATLKSKVSEAIMRNAKDEESGKWANFGYQTAMSIAENAYRMLLTGGFGGAVEGEIGRGLSEAASLLIMGTSVFSQEYADKLKSGYGEGRALVLATTAGAAEVITEKIGIDELMDTIAGKNKSMLVALLKNAFAEGGEEVGSDVMNGIADALINKGASQFNTSVRQYQRDGLSLDEATQKAIGDTIEETFMSFLGGAVSGMVMGGGAQAVNSAQIMNHGKSIIESGQVETLTWEAGSLKDAQDPTSDVAIYLDKVMKNPTATNVGNLSIAVEQASYQEATGSELYGMMALRNAAARLAQGEVIQSDEYNDLARTSGVQKLLKTESDENVNFTDKEKVDVVKRVVKKESENIVKQEEEWKQKVEKARTESVEKMPFEFKEARELFGTKTTESDLDMMNAFYDGADGKQLRDGLTNGSTKEVYSAYLAGRVSYGRRFQTADYDSRVSDYNNYIKGEKYGESSVLHGVGKRSNVQSSGEELGGVESRTRGIKETFVAVQKDAADSEIAAVRVGTSKEVTAKSLGLKNGTDMSKVYVLDEDQYTPLLKDSQYFASQFGVKMVAFVGANLSFEDSSARGMADVTNKVIYIRADDKRFTSYDLMRHEMFHQYIGGNISLVDDMWGALENKVNGLTTGVTLDTILGFYKDSYKGCEEEFIKEEILADFYAGMNVFSEANEDQKRYHDEVAVVLPQISSFEQNVNNLAHGMMAENAIRNGQRQSFSSIGFSFFGDENISTNKFLQMDYKNSDGYKKVFKMYFDTYMKTHPGKSKKQAQKEIEYSIDGIVRVAIAAKKAGYDIIDSGEKRNVRDSKGRLLFSSLEPNSDYFTSSDIASICDKRLNYTDIYEEIVRRETEMGVPDEKRFFKNVNNYFVLYNILAEKGLTTQCRQCFADAARKNLMPMALSFLELVNEENADNRSNNTLYQNGGKLKEHNAKLREDVRAYMQEKEVDQGYLTVEMLTTQDGLAQLKIQHPRLYEAFNSFYGQAKPKMPRSASPFRFGELISLLTDENGNIKQSLIDKINSTGGFRLQSYSDFQIANFVDVLQTLFEASVLGLKGHAYTKVPAFLDCTKGTNLKRNISIFMYQDGDNWVLDKTDSFPAESIEDIYDIVNADKSGNTTIIAVSQNAKMSAYVMANDNIGYNIPFHKSQNKMSVVRDTVVKENGREIKGYQNIKDHTKQQTEVWATTTPEHKAFTKVKKGINIYSDDLGWDFENKKNLPKKEHIKENLKKYIDACKKNEYIPKFREYIMNNDALLNDVLYYSKQLGYSSEDATIDDISFEYKGYRIPYGYYKNLGDWQMYTPDGKAAPAKELSLMGYDFDEAVAFFNDSEKLHRNEILQQFANGEERKKYRESGLTAEELKEIVKQKRQQVVDEVINRPSAEIDAEYMELAKNPEKNGTRLRELVDGAAKKAGYTTEVFHGTHYKGDINKFRSNKKEINGRNKIVGYFSDQENYTEQFGDKTYSYYLNPDKFLWLDGAETTEDMTDYLESKGVTDVVFNDFITDEDQLQDWLDNYAEIIDPWMFVNENGGNITERIAEAGYKGVYWSEGNFNEDGGTAYAPFNSSLVKSADLVTYDDNGDVIPLSKRFNFENDDIRYSSEIDNEGNRLTEAQQDYFKDSKVRDKDGNLILMYHGTSSNFTVFEDKFIGRTGAFEGVGFNFTPSETRAKSYAYTGKGNANVLKGYVNITNPLSNEKVTMNVRELANLIIEVDPTGDNIIAGYAKDTRDYGKESFVKREALTAARLLLQSYDNDVDIYSGISGGAGGNVELMNAFKGLGYDGVIHYNSYNGEIKTAVTFSSNQFKNIENLNPTESSDIRYSSEIDGQMSFDDFMKKTDDGKQKQAISVFLNNQLTGNGEQVTIDQFMQILNKNADLFSQKYVKSGIDNMLQKYKQIYKDLINDKEIQGILGKHIDLGLNVDMIRDGVVNFNGTNLDKGWNGEQKNYKAYQDVFAARIAEMAQILRNPYFEVSRVFYVSRDGTILGSEARTSFAHTYVSFGRTSDYANEIDDRADQLGAEYIYTMHNHPSGDATPSGKDGDIGFVGAIGKRLRHKYMGEIILDHTKYTHIKADQSYGTYDVDQKYDYRNENVGLLGTKFDYKSVAKYLEDTITSEESVVLVLANRNFKGDLKVSGVVELPHFELDKVEQFTKYVQEVKTSTGSITAYLWSTNPQDCFIPAVLDAIKKKALAYVISKRRDGGYYAADWTNRKSSATNWYGEKSGILAKQVEKMSAETDEIALMQQNSALKKTLAATKREFKRMQEWYHTQVDYGVTRESADKWTKQFLKGMGDNINFELVSKCIQDAGTAVLQGTENVNSDRVKAIVYPAAADIVKNAYEMVETDSDNAYLRSKFKQIFKSGIYIPVSESKNDTDFNLKRKQWFGRVRVTSDPTKGRDLQDTYEALVDELKGYIDIENQYNNHIELLEYLLDVYKSLEMIQQKMYQGYDFNECVNHLSEQMQAELLNGMLKQSVYRKYESDVQKQYDIDLELERDRVKRFMSETVDSMKKQETKALNAMRQYYEESIKRMSEGTPNARLKRILKRLQNKKTTQVNRAFINELIGDIDPDYVKLTGHKLKDLQDLRRFINQQEENGIFVDPVLKKRVEKLEMKHVGDMSKNEVETIIKTLLNLENEIRINDQMLRSEDKRKIREQALDVMTDVHNARSVMPTDSKSKTSVGQNIHNASQSVLNWAYGAAVFNTLSPTRAIRRMTNYNESDPLYKATLELELGEAAAQNFTMEATNMFTKWTDNKSLMKKWAGKNAEMIDIGRGIKITPAMRMSIYMHSQNQDNLKHIVYGGLVIPDSSYYQTGNYGIAYQKGKIVKLTLEDIQQITKEMSEEEIAFCKQASFYYGVKSQNKINKVSELLKGYSLAEVRNYFPIDVDSHFLDSDYTMLKCDGTVEGMGFLKERVSSSKPIMLRDINDVITKSIDGTAKYVGLGIPVRNMNKLLNITDGDFIESGRYPGEQTSYSPKDSIMYAISQRFGNTGTNYIVKMMADLQNRKHVDDNWETAFRKIRSRYAGAVLTLNGGVMVKQAASYPTAMAILGAAPLAKAMRLSQLGKVDLDLIAKYTPVQWYRSRGYSTQEIGDLKKSGLQLPSWLNWIQAMDLWTTRKLWKASEFYVQDNNWELKEGKIKKGSKEYYEAVAKIYNRVIWDTQPNYDTMHRPDNLRGGFISGVINMFKTQPFQNFNVIYDAAGNLIAKRNKFNAMQSLTGATEQQISAARNDFKIAGRNFRNAVASQIIQNVVFAAMTVLWKAVRGKYKDDDEETFGNILKDLGVNTVASAVGVLPLTSNIYDLIKGWVDGRYYGYESVTDSAINNFLTAIYKLKDTITGGDFSWDKIDDSLSEIAQFSGMPYNNIKNLVNIILQFFNIEL